ARADDLLSALGLKKSTLPIEEYRNGPRHVLLGLPDIPALSALRPDLLALSDHEDMSAPCFAGKGTEGRMRTSAPAYGVTEDAATGSAAGPLAIHLARHGLLPFGPRIEIQQGVEMGRTSRMYARAEGTPEKVTLVEVSGTAVVVAHGTFT